MDIYKVMQNDFHYAIHCFPGLGLNKEIFDQLSFPGYEVHTYDWLEPAPHEPLAQYASRFAGQLRSPSIPKVIIGHSFGGVLAQEISQHTEVLGIILLSSVRSDLEIPPRLHWVAKWGLYRLVSKWNILCSFPFWGFWHGVKSKNLEQVFLNSFSHLSSHYFRWALLKLGTWPGLETNTPIIQIHGSADKTFPLNRIQQPTKVIVGGGHLMLYNQGKEITKVIEEELRLFNFRIA